MFNIGINGNNCIIYIHSSLRIYTYIIPIYIVQVKKGKDTSLLKVVVFGGDCGTLHTFTT